MGSPADEANRDKDEVQHEVEFSRGFFMAETECTQAQWEAILPKNPSHGKAPDQPVNQVNWREAQDYCRALTERHRAQGLIPAGWEWDLPTEAQWEYACRAGTTGAFAGDLPTLAWIESNSEGKPHAVKTRQPNAWGLHDLHGNVWEWCRDWYGDYATNRVKDPSGPSAGSFRCYRGGSRIYGARRARSAIRGAMTPEMRGDYLGFRPVLLPSP
jgi:formylglycine-generating enzyme required for sulfatase activity